MKNFQQTPKQQRRVKLDKLKHSFAMKQKANWPIKEQKDILIAKQNVINFFYWF